METLVDSAIKASWASLRVIEFSCYAAYLDSERGGRSQRRAGAPFEIRFGEVTVQMGF